MKFLEDLKDRQFIFGILVWSLGFQNVCAGDTSETPDVRNENTVLKKEIVVLISSFFCALGVVFVYWFFIGRVQDRVRHATYGEVDAETRNEFTIGVDDDEEE